MFLSAVTVVLLCVLTFSDVKGQYTGQIRLVSNNGSTNTSEGRLEIYYNRQWGSVCDDRFGSTDAWVVCRELGYTGYSKYGSIGTLGFNPASFSSPIWLDEVSCTTRSAALRYCRSNRIGTHDCTHAEDVAVKCTGGSQYTGQIRLITSNGSPSTAGGRLEINYRGQWGTVCDDRFGSTDAGVVCRELGYTYASSYGRVGTLGYAQATNSTPIWLDEVRCSSSTSALRYCSSSGIGIHNCGHSEDVAVICSNIPSGKIRLVTNSGSTFTSGGRLEIYYNGQWGTVCNDRFGSTDAGVVCRELGYTYVSRYGRVVSLGYTWANTSTPIWLDEVRCTSVSSALRYCSSSGIGTHNCGHSRDVAVICSNTLSTTRTRASTSALSTGVDTQGIIIGVSVGIPVGLSVLCFLISFVCRVLVWTECCTCCCESCLTDNEGRAVTTTPAPAVVKEVHVDTTKQQTAYPMDHDEEVNKL